MIQPWEYETEGFKRLGLLFSITHEGQDAVAHPMTQKEVRAMKRFLDKYESYIRNARSEGYDSTHGGMVNDPRS